MDTVLTVLKCVGLFYLVLYTLFAVLVVVVTVRDRRDRAAWEASHVPDRWVEKRQGEHVT